MTISEKPPIAAQAHWRSGYDGAVAALIKQLNSIPAGDRIRLAKRTSNLFRPRDKTQALGLDVGGFDGVLAVDTAERTAQVLGMTTYEHLVAATLPYGLIPMCVPQLRTITLGGAVTGLGIESASFRQGLPHESVLEMDILTGAGEVLTVSGAASDPHRELFYGFANSYGSLGYALRLKIELEPAKAFVHIRHLPFATAAELTDAMGAIVASGVYGGARVDFLDGTVFSKTEHYLTLGEMVDVIPAGLSVSDYTGMDIYYRSIQSKSEDLLTIHDYLWRWDTDWFWCSKAFGAQHPLIRRFWPKSRLRSNVYWKLMAFDRRLKLKARLGQLLGKPAQEPVVQDVEVPISALPNFLDFFHDQIGISPVWVCPLKQRDPAARWPLYEFDPQQTYVNVGFWAVVNLPAGTSAEEGRFNRLIERRVTDLEGRKSLYSTAFYDRDSFWSMYGGDDYRELKTKYDPRSRFTGLYEKVVQQH